MMESSVPNTTTPKGLFVSLSDDKKLFANDWQLIYKHPSITSYTVQTFNHLIIKYNLLKTKNNFWKKNYSLIKVEKKLLKSDRNEVKLCSVTTVCQTYLCSAATDIMYCQYNIGIIWADLTRGVQRLLSVPVFKICTGGI